MLNRQCLVLILSLLIFSACHKQNVVSQPTVEPIPTRVDTQSVRLKEIVVERLPRPYYRYEYDEKGFVNKISHSSGEQNYTAYYDANGRIKKLVNLVMFSGMVINNDSLLYYYADNKISRIDIVDMTNKKLSSVDLAYDFSGRLAGLVWRTYNNGVSEFSKRLVFSYRTDDNLASYEEYAWQNGAFRLMTTNTFLQYDNKVNVERNRLIKGYGEHFLYLPQVMLQKNNCLKENFRGGTSEMEFTYTFTYNNELPVQKVTNFNVIAGPGAGNPVQPSTTWYSYY